MEWEILGELAGGMRVLIYLPLAIYRAGDRLILIDAYLVDRRLIRRRRGNYHWLDTAAV
jgi:hypothetical protein